MPQFKFNTISRTDIESSVGGAQMINAIDYDGPLHLLITGPPGSGKTTVDLMRAQRLVKLGKKILLLTYQDLLCTSLYNIADETLAPYITTLFRWYKNNFGYLDPSHSETEMLAAMARWNGIDEIIIDEGQDLEARVYKAFIKKCKKLTVGADNAQKVHERGITSLEIRNELSATGTQPLPIQLLYNYRNTFEIYDFARHFLPYNQIVNNELAIERITRGKGEQPTMFLVPDENTRAAQLKILLENAGDRNVAVLVYGRQEVDNYASLIRDSLGIPCSKHHSKSHIGHVLENVLVTTFKSAKGLEFQVVILPNMETARDQYYKTAEHYFVACTRAKENLYLIAAGTKVPFCMRDFDQTSYSMIRVPKLPFPKKAVTRNDFELPDLPF